MNLATWTPENSIAYYKAVRARLYDGRQQEVKRPVVKIVIAHGYVPTRKRKPEEQLYDEPIGPKVWALDAPTVIRQILSEVSRKHEVQEWDVLGQSRQKKVHMARLELYYRVKQLPKWSYPRIGKLFRRDHSTIVHGVKRWMSLQNGTPYCKNQKRDEAARQARKIPSNVIYLSERRVDA